MGSPRWAAAAPTLAVSGGTFLLLNTTGALSAAAAAEVGDQAQRLLLRLAGSLSAFGWSVGYARCPCVVV
jgi:formate hydrogenlyase subunit 3/multisubunit Na+/H+ antiporter MnhD subunit